MGNICGKPEPEGFSQPGRVLGTAPPQGPRTASVPKKVGGPPRTLGSASSPTSNEPGDARRRAAEAAEARAKVASKPGGKLQQELSAQKSKSRSETLKDASQQEVQAREAAAAAQVRNWD